jgi:hypothetical protein
MCQFGNFVGSSPVLVQEVFETVRRKLRQEFAVGTKTDSVKV